MEQFQNICDTIALRGISMEKKTIFIMAKPSEYKKIASSDFITWLEKNQITPTTHNIWLPYHFTLVHPDAEMVKSWSTKEKDAWFQKEYPVLYPYYQLEHLENMLSKNSREISLIEKLNYAKAQLKWIKEANLVGENYQTMPNIGSMFPTRLVLSIYIDSYEKNKHDFEIVLRHNLRKHNLEQYTRLLVNYHSEDYEQFVRRANEIEFDFTKKEVYKEQEEIEQEFQYAVENKILVKYDITYEKK